MPDRFLLSESAARKLSEIVDAYDRGELGRRPPTRARKTDPGNWMRLWRFTLNEAFSGSPPAAAADLLYMNGTDTGDDVTIQDYLSIFSSDLTTADAGYCLQQGDVYIAIQAPCP